MSGRYAGVHQPVAVRARDGWARWSAGCGCGWRAAANSREDAEQRAREHGALTAALAIVETELPETCYHAESMEYGPDYPCTRCKLRETLGGAA